MSAKIEQVALAIAKAQMEKDQIEAVRAGNDVALVIDAYIPWARGIARLAIEAMRDPTPLMWWAGTAAIEEKRDFATDSEIGQFECTDPSDQAVPCYQAMIDAALGGWVKHAIYHTSNPSPQGEERRAAEMHPEEYLSSIGVTYDRSEPNALLERWHLFGVRGLPSPLPDWFTVVKDKP